MRSRALTSRAPHGMMGDRVSALRLPHDDDHLLVSGAATQNRSGQGDRNLGAAPPVDGAATAGGQARVHAGRSVPPGRAASPPSDGQTPAPYGAGPTGHHPAPAPRSAAAPSRRGRLASRAWTSTYRPVHPEAGVATGTRERLMGISAHSR